MTWGHAKREKATKACCDTFGDPVLPTAERGHSGRAPVGIEPLSQQPLQSQFICERTCRHTVDEPLHE